jgi:hypothetical protein
MATPGLSAIPQLLREGRKTLLEEMDSKIRSTSKEKTDYPAF